MSVRSLQIKPENVLEPHEASDMFRPHTAYQMSHVLRL